VVHSPIAFYAERRLLVPALPRIADGKVEIREYPVVVGGRRGSRVTFAGDRLRVDGADETLQDVHEERGARVQDGRLRLRGRWDGLFVRAAAAAQGRDLVLHVVGEGTGTLYVGERSFWNPAVRWTAYPMNGAVDVRHPYRRETSGGPDLQITLGRAAGSADLVAVSLAPRGEPDRVLRLP
jgi:hypothetical protein